MLQSHLAVSGMIVLVSPSAVVSIVVFVCSSISPSAKTSDAPENVIDAAHTIAVKTEEAFFKHLIHMLTSLRLCHVFWMDGLLSL